MIVTARPSGLLIASEPPPLQPAPEPPRLPRLAACVQCNSTDIEVCEKTSTYQILCNACGHRDCWRYALGPGGLTWPDHLVNQPYGSEKL